MRTKDVFTPGQYPTVTFISDHLSESSSHLRGAIESGGLVISLSGPSKSGKTVFIEKEIGKDNLIHITGAGIDSPEKLWNRAFDIIGTPVSTVDSHGKAFTGKFGAKAGGAVGFFVKGTGEVTASGEWSKSESTSTSIDPDSLQLLIKELKGSGFFLFIDDFHYISDLVKPEIAMQIKECIRNNVSVIVASVPYRSDDVIRSNSDLRGRMLKIDFKYWESAFLKKIAIRGFAELGISVDEELTSRFVSEAAGSPQLMQALCLNLCFEKGIYETLEVFEKIEMDEKLFAKVCSRTALMTDYSTCVSLMKEGPKTRGTVRHTHRMRNGEAVDVYSLILDAISQNPPELTFRYAALNERIKGICMDEGPVGSSVTGACLHMARIANESSNGTIVEWDSDHDVLDIRDPYLLFYLRWGR